MNYNTDTNTILTFKNINFSHYILLLIKGGKNTSIKKQNENYPLLTDSLVFIKKNTTIDISYSKNHKPEYLLLSYEILLEILKLSIINKMCKQEATVNTFIKKADKEDALFFMKLKSAFNGKEITLKNTNASQLLKISYLLLGFDMPQCIFKVELFSDKVKKIINTQLNYPWTLKDISNKLFMSQSSLRKKLESEKTNFMTLLTDMRMTHAMHLLATTELPIGKISELTGYKSTSYFIKKFKEYYKKPPKRLKITKKQG